MLDAPETAAMTGANMGTERLAKIVGFNIREQRKARGMSMKELGALCGTTPQTIQRIEMAAMTVSMDWIDRVCRALAIRPHALFGHLAEAEMKRREREIEDFRDEVRSFRARIDHFLELTEKDADVDAIKERHANADPEPGTT